MCKTVASKISAITMAAVVLIAPTNVSAEAIALTFRQNGITLTGEFAGFQQNAYIIVTNGRQLFVPAIHVTCEGADCFDIAAPLITGS